MRSIVAPPTKPMWPSSDARAAAAPTRYEPCSSANTRLATFGRSTTESTIAKCVSGYASAACVTLLPHRKPTATMSWLPSSAAAVMRSARSPSPPGVDSVPLTPNSSTAWSSPAAAASLNDLSPRPVTSNMSATLTSPSTAEPSVMPSASVAAGSVPAASVPAASVPAASVAAASVPAASVPSAAAVVSVAASVPSGAASVAHDAGSNAAPAGTRAGTDGDAGYSECGGESGRKRTLALDHWVPLQGIVSSFRHAAGSRPRLRRVDEEGDFRRPSSPSRPATSYHSAAVKSPAQPPSRGPSRSAVR